MQELAKKIQLQNEMLLTILKTDDQFINNVDEEIIDYFTENVIKNSESKTFKEHYNYLFKDMIHCPYCGSAKHLVISGFNPRPDVTYHTYLCKNCSNIVREYEDGKIEIEKGG